MNHFEPERIQDRDGQQKDFDPTTKRAKHPSPFLTIDTTKLCPVFMNLREGKNEDAGDLWGKLQEGGRGKASVDPFHEDTRADCIGHGPSGKRV
ncbi:hypothetical protein E2C01_017672 [Portunus trituberculatus]|uniref:Uncharacterized protein n=1 Tax=Portunus trituberculatus TaxID=210409 RepID=A0A5B7DU54_PORTR|nr:hypothetical protein [Portunus trituberculatus]